MAKQTSPIFGITYPMVKGQNGYFNTSNTVMNQIKSNLKNLLLTRIGERLAQPTLGSDLHKIVFEPNDDNIKQKATDYIEAAISTWMPYISVENLAYTVSATDKDNNNFYIVLTFSFNNQISNVGLSITP